MWHLPDDKVVELSGSTGQAVIAIAVTPNRGCILISIDGGRLVRLDRPDYRLETSPSIDLRPATAWRLEVAGGQNLVVASGTPTFASKMRVGSTVASGVGWEVYLIWLWRAPSPAGVVAADAKPKAGLRAPRGPTKQARLSRWRLAITAGGRQSPCGSTLPGTVPATRTGDAILQTEPDHDALIQPAPR